ncbi:hypothetical protein TNCV_277081 [Trichonephila clavipes]|uniref:Uncharacterized protein n=1 Tax=Trichonephila clavipes TaxID=2585209 RepID=A0A8X6SEV3_TRICX|nr:hypothetical protein TNCV_277081 [Trichonephila clavipes]
MKSCQRWDSNPRLWRDWCLKTSALDRSATLPSALCSYCSFIPLENLLQNALKNFWENKKRNPGSGGIRTHASGETGALNQRLRPLGHATVGIMFILFFYSFGTFIVKCIKKLFVKTKKENLAAVGFEHTPRRDRCLKPTP